MNKENDTKIYFGLVFFVILITTGAFVYLYGIFIHNVIFVILGFGIILWGVLFIIDIFDRFGED